MGRREFGIPVFMGHDVRQNGPISDHDKVARGEGLAGQDGGEGHRRGWARRLIAPPVFEPLSHSTT
jgi:hypothetical protein